MYGHDVFRCLYDEQPVCERFQSECKDTDSVVCSPRVVNLGSFDPRPTATEYGSAYYGTQPVPAPSSLPLMGP